MTKLKKQQTPEELLKNAAKLFDECIIKYDPHHFKRITAAETMFQDYKSLQTNMSIEGLQAKADLLIKACLLHPYYDGFVQPLVAVLAKFNPELAKALIGKFDDTLQDLPVYKQIEEFKTPFYEKYVENDAIYLEVEKVNEKKAKAREVASEEKSTAVSSRFASNTQLMDTAVNWRNKAVAEEPRRRKKQAAEIMAEVEARKSLTKKEQLDSFSIAELEITAAYLDNENAAYTETAKNHLKAKKKVFTEEQVASLVSNIDFMRTRVMPERAFRIGAGEMIMLLQPSK